MEVAHAREILRGRRRAVAISGSPINDEPHRLGRIGAHSVACAARAGAGRRAAVALHGEVGHRTSRRQARTQRIVRNRGQTGGDRIGHRRDARADLDRLGRSVPLVERIHEVDPAEKKQDQNWQNDCDLDQRAAIFISSQLQR